MKKTGCILIAVFLLMAGCTLMENFSTIGGDFWLKMGDGSIVSASDIDFYDVSLHTIYLKKEVPYLKKAIYNHGTMSVYVDNTQIYECTFHSLACSHIAAGVSVYNYYDDIIHIHFQPSFYSDVEITDPRNDRRIIAALKNNRLYHEGLRCEIQSVNYSNGKLTLNLELSNPDTFDYYHLDPDKMGIGLFHYFTNGPYIWNNPYTNTYTHQETVIQPVPWDSWDKKWLSLIKSGAQKNISITYQRFDKIPAGKYRMSFTFPGFYRLSKEERHLGSGRIWMGSIYKENEITIK